MWEPEVVERVAWLLRRDDWTAFRALVKRLAPASGLPFDKAATELRTLACTPVRLEVRAVSRYVARLVLVRDVLVLAELGRWTRRAGWDLTLAGDTHARSLARVLPQLVVRYEAQRKQREGAPALGVGA